MAKQGKHSASKSKSHLRSAAMLTAGALVLALGVLGAAIILAHPDASDDTVGYSPAFNVPMPDVTDVRARISEAPDETPEETSKAPDAPEEEPTPESDADDFSGAIDAETVLAMPREHDPAAFSVNPDRERPDLTPETLATIAEMASRIEEAGYLCSFVFLDVGSGRGVAGNAGEAIYTASSFKAPFAYYLLSRNEAADYEREMVEASILYSDNDAYEALASPHMDEDFTAWLEAHGIEYDDWSPWYPHASAAGMTSCWADMYRFFENGGEDAQWLRGLLADTNLSFIRIALEDSDVRVWNKAGWLADPEYDAVCDCGIIEGDGRTYLMCIMTNQPSYGDAHERFESLAHALFETRSALA